MRSPRRSTSTAARLIDALLENLALLVLAIEHELVGVLRRVQLAHRGIDADLPEHSLHAEGSRFVGDDGHDVLADVLVLDQDSQHPHQAMVVEISRSPVPSSNALNASSGGTTKARPRQLRAGR